MCTCRNCPVCLPVWPSMKWAVMICSLVPSGSSLNQVTCTTFSPSSTRKRQGSLVSVSARECWEVTGWSGSTKSPFTPTTAEKKVCTFYIFITNWQLVINKCLTSRKCNYFLILHIHVLIIMLQLGWCMCTIVWLQILHWLGCQVLIMSL